MSKMNVPTVELVSTLRAAPLNGAPSSQDYNDDQSERITDLASLSMLINDTLIPLINGLDAGAIEGLEGRYIYGDTSDTTDLFYNDLAGEPLSVADSLRLLLGQLTKQTTNITDLTVQVLALQTRLASTNQNDIATALQNFAQTLQALSTTVGQQASTLSGLQIQINKTKVAVSAQSSALTTGTPTLDAVSFAWPTAFADNNYSLAVSLEIEGTLAAADAISVNGFAYQSAGAGVNINVLYNVATSGLKYTVHVTATHN